MEMGMEMETGIGKQSRIEFWNGIGIGSKGVPAHPT